MKNQRGFVSVLIAILIGVVVLGGGAYLVMQSGTGTSEQTAPTENLVANVSGITITTPVTGTTLYIDEETTVGWTIPNETLDLFPDDFDVFVFLYVLEQGNLNGTYSASIGDGHKASAGSAKWNIPISVTSRSLKPGTYKIIADLQAVPKDRSRLCDSVMSKGKDCIPSVADSAVMKRAVGVKGETGWFTIAPSTTVSEIDATTPKSTSQDDALSSTLPSIAEIAVGGKVGAFIVTDISSTTRTFKDQNGNNGPTVTDYSVLFSGQTTITGILETGGFFGTERVTFKVQRVDNPQLPRFWFKETYQDVLIVCVRNSEIARPILLGMEGKKVTAVVKDYSVNLRHETAFCDGVDFLKVN